MRRNLSRELFSWLKQLKIYVSESYLNRQLLSHPDYPSLLSITDTLNELNIENTAIEIGKDHLHEVPVPFLTHLKTNGGEFVIVKHRDNLDKQFPRFFDRWSGVVVLAEKPAAWRHEENNSWLRKEKQKKFKIAAIVSALFAFVTASSIMSQQWLQAALFFIGLAGIFTSWLIVSKELGIENGLANQVCGEEDNCTSLIKSNGAKLPLGMSWGDIGILWFSFLLLSLIITSFTRTSSNLYTFLSFLATCSLPFAIFSIYYQWKVAKKWCRLCLFTLLLLSLQFLSSYLNVISAFKSSNGLIMLSLFLLFIISSAWFSIKETIKENKALEHKDAINKKFKTNVNVFNTLLKEQRMIDDSPFEDEFQLGNPYSDLQLMVAADPLCFPCSTTHKILESLSEKNDIGLTVRFIVKTNKVKIETVRSLLQLARGQDRTRKKQILHEWYEIMNLEKFIHLHPINHKDTDNKLVQKYNQWAIENGIVSTPTIFINGREAPKLYSTNDLVSVVKLLVMEYKLNKGNPMESFNVEQHKSLT